MYINEIQFFVHLCFFLHFGENYFFIFFCLIGRIKGKIGSKISKKFISEFSFTKIRLSKFFITKIQLSNFNYKTTALSPTWHLMWCPMWRLFFEPCQVKTELQVSPLVQIQKEIEVQINSPKKFNHWFTLLEY